MCYNLAFGAFHLMYMSCMHDRDNALTLLLALEQDQVCAVVIGVTLAQSLECVTAVG